MTTALEIHAASPDELVAAHRNVFDIWSQGLPLEDHVQSRLNSPKHRLATWYVGRLDGRVVVSLGCYPLRFQIRGAEVSGIAIGSVYALAEYRGRGFAPQLLAWVEEHERQQAAALSLLYSDIKPDYYARLGYVLCPSFEGWRDVRGMEDKAGAERPIIEIDAATRIDELMNLYAGYHGAAPLSIARSAAYWRALLQRFTGDEFFGLVTERGDLGGYVRLSRNDADWRIMDYALADQRTTLAERLYSATLALAARSGARRVGGWLPEDSVTRKAFELVPRRKEITMIKPLSGAYPLDDEMIAAAAQFCEIDHV